MKNQILFLLTILGMALNLTSCSSEDIQAPVDMESISFDINVPADEMRTRAYGDGTSVLNIACYVYPVGSTQPSMIKDIPLTTTGGKRGGSLNIDIPSGAAYDFVFVATHGHRNDAKPKVRYDAEKRTLNLDYNNIVANDEDVDCFFGVLKNISITKGTSHSITLKRPYAQLNIGTKDLDVYNKLSSASLKTVGVSVDGVYTSMNVMDGSVAGDPVKVSFTPAAMPTGEIFPVKDAKYLAMDYLLVKDRKDVTVSMTASNGSSSFNMDFPNIPLQRNYQTNIYGNLLTEEKDFKVEIKPEFSGVDNDEFETGEKVYDLIIKLKYSSIVTPLVVTDKQGNQTKIALTPYKDSENYVKVTWKELGISEASNIRFSYHDKNTSDNQIPILSVIKCDINKLNITDLSHIFSCCTSLKDIPAIQEWNTADVKDMSHMFHNCENLESLDISNFDTSNVTDMSYMFSNCVRLQFIDVSNFDTSNVTDMGYMFAECGSFSSLDVSNFDTSNVKSMRGMFANDVTIQSLDVSNFDTSNVTDMGEMFYNCRTLTELNIANFDTSNVTDMYHMFAALYKIKSLDLSMINTSKVTDMGEMFAQCSSLSSLDISNFDTSNVTNMKRMFYNCSSFTKLDLRVLNTSMVTDMTEMFYNCNSLYAIDLSSFDTSKVRSMRSMFQLCRFSSIDVSNFDTSNVTDMSSIFMSCVYLKLLCLSNFDTSNVTNMRNMFYNCLRLQSIDICNFDSSNVTDMGYMFAECSSLGSLDISSFNTSNVTDMSHMFYNCASLKELDLSNFDISNVRNNSSWLEGCNAIVIGL